MLEELLARTARFELAGPVEMVPVAALRPGGAAACAVSGNLIYRAVLDREPDWHPLAPEARIDPAAAQAALRERCPVAWTDDLGGFWSVLRYEDVVAVARDTDTFSNALRPRLGTARVPLETDRPDHTRYRRLLQPHFSPQRMRELEPRVRQFVVELLEPLLAAGGGDVAPALTYPLPARVVCELLDVPDDDWPFDQAGVRRRLRGGPGAARRPRAFRAGERAALRVLPRARRSGRCRMANDLLDADVDAETHGRRDPSDDLRRATTRRRARSASRSCGSPRATRSRRGSAASRI